MYSGKQHLLGQQGVLGQTTGTQAELEKGNMTWVYKQMYSRKLCIRAAGRQTPLFLEYTRVDIFLLYSHIGKGQTAHNNPACNLGPVRASSMCTHMRPYNINPYMSQHGPIWAHMAPHGTHMGPYGAHMGRMWAHMDRIDEFTYFFAWVTRTQRLSVFSATDTK